jgi:hypothetical protein
VFQRSFETAFNPDAKVVSSTAFPLEQENPFQQHHIDTFEEVLSTPRSPWQRQNTAR